MRLTIGEDLVFQFAELPSGLQDRIAERFRHYLQRPAVSSPSPLLISTALPPANPSAPESLVALRPPLRVQRQGRILLYQVRGVTGWCDPQTGRGGIHVGAAEPSALDSFAAMAIPSMLFELAANRGWLGVHAAAIVMNGRGILLPGPSGAGKSTLFELARTNGLGVLSDDLTWLQDQPDGPFRLWAGPAAGSPTQVLPTADGVPLAAIVCPTITGRQASRLVALSLPQLLEVLLPQCSFLALGSEAGDRFGRLIRAADSATAYRLEAGGDRSETIRILGRLFSPC